MLQSLDIFANKGDLVDLGLTVESVPIRSVRLRYKGEGNRTLLINSELIRELK